MWNCLTFKWVLSTALLFDLLNPKVTKGGIICFIYAYVYMLSNLYMLDKNAEINFSRQQYEEIQPRVYIPSYN